MTDRKDIDIKALKAALLKHRRELVEDEQISAESRQTVEADQGRFGRLSRMEALQDQAMAVETERRRVLELQRIEAALERIKEGDYGYCTACGEEIAAKRLEFDPATPTCINCAGKSRGT
jgi:DnaK suppressor protein